MSRDAIKKSALREMGLDNASVYRITVSEFEGKREGGRESERERERDEEVERGRERLKKWTERERKREREGPTKTRDMEERGTKDRDKRFSASAATYQLQHGRRQAHGYLLRMYSPVPEYPSVEPFAEQHMCEHKKHESLKLHQCNEQSC